MNRIVKTGLKISAFIIILLVLIVGAGVGYIWYSGQNNNQVVASETPPETKVETVKKPTPLAENAKVGVSVQALTSPILPGDNSSITIKTNSDAKCTISVIYDKTPSADSGLVAKTADEYGVASWTWTVEKSVPLGKWPVKVTCSKDKLSGVAIGDLKVVKQIEE